MADISKIRLSDGSEYNIKDAEFRHILNILLGLEEPEDKETSED